MEPSVTLNDGTQFPWPVYGSGTTLRDKDVSKQILDAINAGFRHIDCAQMYNNEESVGEGIAQSCVPRAELYITTKLIAVPDGKTAKDTLRESLRKMQLDYVDLFLVHLPIGHSDLSLIWKEMEECKALGLARSIGVSNFRIQDFEEIRQSATFIPVVNQIEMHPYIYKASLPVIDYMRKHNILPTSYAGLAPLSRAKGGQLDPVLDGVASGMRHSKQKSVTAAQILQLWLRKKGIPYTTTTSKSERLREYLDVAGLPDISSEDERRIDEAGSSVHHRFFCKFIEQ